MPVRDFASGGVIRTSVGSCNVEDPFTFVSLVKLGEGSEWLIARGSGTHSAVPWTSFGVEIFASTGLRFYPEGEVSGGFEPPRGVWLLVAGSKPDGKTKSKFYVYNFATETLTEKESAEAWDSLQAGVPVEIQFGRWGNGDQFHGRYAAASIFDYALTKAQIEELLVGTVKDWLNLNPVGLWMFNQKTLEGVVVDKTGNGADQISLVGTTVAEEEPPIPYEPPFEGGGSVMVLVGEELVPANRYVKIGGELVGA